MKNIPIVIITSLEFSADDENLLHVIASICDYESKKITLHHAKIPKYKKYYSGTGDLFAALIFGWWKKQNYSLDILLPFKNTLSTIYSIMNLTNETDSNELLFIEADIKNYITNPPLDKFEHILIFDKEINNI